MMFIPVQSSTIASVCYVANSSMLYINFVNGTCYVFKPVPHDVYVDLMAAPSKGKFFNDVIKHGYAFERCY